MYTQPTSCAQGCTNTYIYTNKHKKTCESTIILVTDPGPLEHKQILYKNQSLTIVTKKHTPGFTGDANPCLNLAFRKVHI